jgi:hypothetical protein
MDWGRRGGHGNGNGANGKTQKKKGGHSPQLLVVHQTYQDLIGGYLGGIIGYQGESIRE